MLVERSPRLFGVDLANAGSASDYRGPDFRKPFARHFTEGYAPNTQRPSDFPVFSGKYSTFSYLDETVHAVERMLSRLQVSAGSYYESVRGLFFHRPYQLMPVQAMSFLYVRGLARGDHHHDELRALCREAGVAFDDVIKETASSPDLYGSLLKDDAVADPYAATTAAASLLRKQQAFRELLSQKMSLGSEAVKELGNLYSAALPAWIAAGLEQAAQDKLQLAGAPLVAVGYGSGDAAEALPLSVASGFEVPAARIGFAQALADSVTLSRAQYEALHDGTQIPSLTYTPKNEFAIARVGKQDGASFQDLGVEYYDFVQ
jgi:hydroxymethylglutaryl-CoA synthase